MSNDVYISGVSAYIPDRFMTVEEASACGRYDISRVEVDKFKSVAIEDRKSVSEMALAAALPLLEAGTTDIRSLYLTSIHRHGHKHLWPPAAFLHRELGLNTDARVMSLSHGCNSAFIACSLAYDLLSAGIGGDHLVVGADRFEDSAFDRWQSDLGTLYGDCAAAVRLSSSAGPLRLEYIGLDGDADLEQMYRADHPSPEGPADHRIGDAKRSYLDNHGKDHFLGLFSAATDRLRQKLLTHTDLGERKADYVIYPNVGAGLSASLYVDAFGDLAQRDVWDFGRTIGHTGTADQFAGLEDLLGRGQLSAGDRVLLIGAGNGLSLAAMLVEVSQPLSDCQPARRTSLA